MPRLIYKGVDLPDQLFPDRVVYNTDGTEPTMPDDDEVISKLEICYLCGTVFDQTWKPYTRYGHKVCRLCLDSRRGPLGNKRARNYVLDSEDSQAIDSSGDYAYGPEGEWIITGER